MPTNSRNYTGADVDMLMATGTIMETAINNKAFLLPKRSSCADPFFDDIKAQIDAAFKNHLGVDSAKRMRQSTQVLLGIQKQAAKDLAEVKVQVDEDFKKDPARRTEILRQLGFTEHYLNVRSKDQEAMISLLYKFSENLPGLRAEIEAKGTDKATLNAVISYAETLKNANVNQETFKGSKKTITAAGIIEFNVIYDDVISICKIAAKFCKEKPDPKEQFSFNKVKKALNKKPGKEEDTPPQA